MSHPGHPNEIIFTAVYDWTASKVLEVLLSVTNVVLLTPLYIYIIWYERYGTGHRRTLINQLVAAQCGYAAFYNLIGIPLHIFIAIFGPVGTSVSHVQQFLGDVVAFQCVQNYIAIVTVKYCFIFAVKNPAGIQEDFWCLFINIWTLMVSSTSQFVHQFLPGRNQLNFYICSGSFDKSLAETKIKMNYFFVAYLAIGLLWIIFAAFRISNFKRNFRPSSAGPASGQNTRTNVAVMLKETLNVSLVNLAMVGIGISLLILILAVPSHLSTLEPTSFNQSPNFEIYHFSQHGFLLCVTILGVSMFYLRNPKARQSVGRKVVDDFEGLKARLLFR